MDLYVKIIIFTKSTIFMPLVLYMYKGLPFPATFDELDEGTYVCRYLDCGED